MFQNWNVSSRWECLQNSIQAWWSIQSYVSHEIINRKKYEEILDSNFRVDRISTVVKYTFVKVNCIPDQGALTNYDYKRRWVGSQKGQLLEGRKCKRSRVGGQKSQELVNVVCERPLNTMCVHIYRKVHVFWEGHKNLTKSPNIFVNLLSDG